RIAEAPVEDRDDDARLLPGGGHLLLEQGQVVFLGFGDGLADDPRIGLGPRVRLRPRRDAYAAEAWTISGEGIARPDAGSGDDGDPHALRRRARLDKQRGRSALLVAAEAKGPDAGPLAGRKRVFDARQTMATDVVVGQRG